LRHSQPLPADRRFEPVHDHGRPIARSNPGRIAGKSRLPASRFLSRGEFRL